MPTISDFDAATQRRRINVFSPRLNVAIGLSVIAHAIVLFGVSFKVPVVEIETVQPPLEVILDNDQSASRSLKPVPVPVKAEANINKRDRPVKSSSSKTSPVISGGRPSPNMAPPQAEVAEAEAEAKAQEFTGSEEGNFDQSPLKGAPFNSPEPSWNNEGKGTMGLVQRSLEIARLQAQAVRNVAYQQSVKRKFIGTRTQDYRFARYMEDWRLKVERIGNLNYPEAAKREQLYGSLQLTVGIRSDGSLESIDINRPSGKKVLDEAAVRIVKLAGQNGFAPFSADMAQEIDVLHITRTWVFTRSDELASE